MKYDSPPGRAHALPTSFFMRFSLRRLAATWVLMCAATLAVPAANAADFGLDVLALLPRGQLDDNLGTGYGVGAQLMFPLGKGPFLIGLDGAVATYSDQRRPFFGDLDVITSNNIGSLNAVLRAQATSGRVRPYLDAIIGVKVFQTESTLVDDCSICDDEPLDSETELDDTAFAYGVGAGAMFEFGESNVFLDTRVRYIRGRDALYLTRGSLADDNLADRLRKSRTDSVSIHIGVTFRLSK